LEWQSLEQKVVWFWVENWFKTGQNRDFPNFGKILPSGGHFGSRDLEISENEGLKSEDLGWRFGADFGRILLFLKFKFENGGFSGWFLPSSGILLKEGCRFWVSFGQNLVENWGNLPDLLIDLPNFWGFWAVDFGRFWDGPRQIMRSGNFGRFWHFSELLLRRGFPEWSKLADFQHFFGVLLKEGLVDFADFAEFSVVLSGIFHAKTFIFYKFN
jgi:hypothetical protein